MTLDEVLALADQADERSILDMLEELEGTISDAMCEIENAYDLLSEIRNRIAPAGDDVSKQ